jgi:hypothetical protein
MEQHDFIHQSYCAIARRGNITGALGAAMLETIFRRKCCRDVLDRHDDQQIARSSRGRIPISTTPKA